MKRVWSIMLSLVLMGLVLIAACAGPAPAEKLESLKIAYLANGMYRDLFIAKEEGFYETNGIDAELVEIRPAPDRMAALTSGQVDVTATSTSSAIAAVAAGSRIKLVVAASRPFEGQGDAYIAVLRDSPYNSIEDLEGKIYATTGMGSSSWLASIEEFDKHGVKADIRLMSPGWMTALLAGQVDAATGFTKDITKFKEEIRPIHTLEAWRTQNAGTGYWVRSELLESKPELIRSLVEALKQARQFIKEHPEQAVKDELKYTKVPEEDWAEEQELLFDNEPVLHMWAMRHIQQGLLKYGLLDQPVDLSDMVMVAPFVKILEEKPE